MPTDIKQIMASLRDPKRLWLWVGAGVILLLACLAIWWVLSPGRQLLFGNLRERDAAEIVQALDEWKVPYEIVDSGKGIKVESDLVYETRMKLVAAGVPKGGHVGFELFDDADFGVTEFAQRVNYQRALQGEIERTIASIPGVESARVHLTIRRPGLFVGEQEQSKGSVALELSPGAKLSVGQISGIRSLVAASVEGLSANQVSVLDTQGSLIASGGNDVAAGTQEASGEEAKLESTIQGRIENLLSQVLSRERFKVSVDVRLNFDKISEISERPITQGETGNDLLVRQRVSTSNGSSGSSNQNESETEFAHGTTRTEISRAPGRIERISVAVILPPNSTGAEIEKIRALVQAAAGIDTDRGDRLEISSLGWSRYAPTSSATTEAPVDYPDAATIRSASRQPAPKWTRWALVGVCSLLLGLILGISLHRRAPKLNADEREAVLAKMRTWLAEGGELS